MLPLISCLPPELVCAVFHRLDVRHLIVASHVCGVWREIALVHAALWTTLDLSGVQNISRAYLDALLSRSRGLPVDLLGFTITTDRSMDAAVALSTHLSHIRVLEVNVAWHEVWDALQFDVLLHAPAPVLEDLTIRELLDCGASPIVHAEIFDEHAPRLTRLRLEGIQPPITPCPAFRQVERFAFRRGRVQTQAAALYLPRIFPRLAAYSLGHTTGFRPSSAPLPPKHRLHSLELTCATDCVRECLSALLPHGHRDIPELVINCPCTEHTADYILNAVNEPLQCTMYEPAPNANGLCITVVFDGGRIRRFQQPMPRNSLTAVLAWMAHNCQALHCPARFLSIVPVLPVLEVLTVDVAGTLLLDHARDFARTLAFQRTPALRMLRLTGNDNMHAHLRPGLFCGILQDRRIGGADSLVDLVLQGVDFESDTTGSAVDLCNLMEMVQISHGRGTMAVGPKQLSRPAPPKESGRSVREIGRLLSCAAPPF